MNRRVALYIGMFIVGLVALGVALVWRYLGLDKIAAIANALQLPVAVLGVVLTITGPPLALRSAENPPRFFREALRGPGAALIGVLVILVAALLPQYLVPFAVGSSPAVSPIDPCQVDVAKSASAATTLKFGTLFPTSGSLQAQGPPLNAAVSLAEEEIVGRIPNVEVVDDSADQLDENEPGSDQACRSAATLLDRGVDVIVGPATSASSQRVYQLAARNSGIVISPAGTAPELSSIADNGSFYRTVPSDVLQGRILADQVARSGKRSVVVVARADPYGRALQNEVVTELSGLGVKVRATSYAPIDQPDFKEAFDLIGSNPPDRPATDGVVLIGFNELSELLKDLIRVNQVPAKGVGIYASDGLVRDTFPSLFTASERMRLQGLQGTRPFIDPGFRARLGSRVQDPTYTAQAYDAVIITALAAAVAGSGNAADFRPQINAVTRAGDKCYSFDDCLAKLGPRRTNDIDYDGSSGPLDFTGAGEPCQGVYSILEYDGSGTFVEKQRALGTYLCTGLIGIPPS